VASDTDGGAEAEVFADRVLRQIFGSKTAELIGSGRRLNSAGLIRLYASPNTVLMITPRRMGWSGMQNVWGTAEEHTGL
jgi:hypothetical protein